MIPQTFKSLSCLMEILNNYAPLIQALVTVILIFFTARLWIATKEMAAATKLLVDENQKRREAARRPRILAKLKPKADAGEFIDIVVNNVGPGAALNVRFQIEGDEADFSKHEVTIKGTSTPISFISQGESEIYHLGTAFFLFGNDSEKPLKPFSVLIEYEDVDRKSYGERITLNVRQFERLEWQGPSVAWRKMRALEKIEKHLKSVSGKRFRS